MALSAQQQQQLAQIIAGQPSQGNGTIYMPQSQYDASAQNALTRPDKVNATNLNGVVPVPDAIYNSQGFKTASSQGPQAVQAYLSTQQGGAGGGYGDTAQTDVSTPVSQMAQDAGQYMTQPQQNDTSLAGQAANQTQNAAGTADPNSLSTGAAQLYSAYNPSTNTFGSSTGAFTTNYGSAGTQGGTTGGGTGGGSGGGGSGGYMPASSSGSTSGLNVASAQATNQQLMQPGYIQSLASQLSGYLSNNLSNYNPSQLYTGQYVAPTTSQQNTGLDILSNYLSQGTGALTQQAQQQASATLSGQYADPNTSPYIQAMIAENQQGLQKNTDALNASRGASGNYFNTQTTAQQNQLSQNALQDLNATVGSFEQNERQNQVGMVTTAANLDQMTQNQQLQQVAASQQYGGLQQQMQQANLEAQYQDWTRTQNQQAALVQPTAGVATSNPSYGSMTLWS